MSKRKIQPTLFAFGVSKKIKHRDEVVNVSLPLRAEEPIPGAYLCSHCPKRFKNTPGLSVHMMEILKHLIVVNLTSLQLSVTSQQ